MLELEDEDDESELLLELEEESLFYLLYFLVCLTVYELELVYELLLELELKDELDCLSFFPSNIFVFN
jgi:hypothetical protein